MTTARNLVSAIGDQGLEKVPASKAVSIGCVSLGTDNEVVPATIRWMSAIKDGGVPIRLLRVHRPSETRGRKYAQVVFECTPFVRYTLDTGPVFGEWASCMVRNLADATDSIFSGLTHRELRRIEHAAKASERFND